MNKNLISIGNSGEYFVAAELERRGFSVALPMSNTPDFDLLAISRDDHSVQYALQVKTQSGKRAEWMLNKKNENLKGDNIFYVFVQLNDCAYPDYYVVPSKVVAEVIKKGHQKWLKTPGRGGKTHNDNPMRKYNLEDVVECAKYHNNWTVLKKIREIAEK